MIDIFNNFIFIIGAIFFYLSFESHDKNKVLIYQFISISFFTFGLYLVNVAPASLFISAISLLQIILGYFSSKEIKEIFLKIVPLISLFTLFFLPYDFGTYLTIIGITFSTFAALSHKIINMKYFYLMSNITWLIFDIYIKSIGAIIFDLVGMIALFIYFKKYFKL